MSNSAADVIWCSTDRTHAAGLPASAAAPSSDSDSVSDSVSELAPVGVLEGGAAAVGVGSGIGLGTGLGADTGWADFVFAFGPQFPLTSSNLLDAGGAVKVEVEVEVEAEVEGSRAVGDSEWSVGGGGAAIDRPYRPAIEVILGATTVVILPDIVGNRALCARYVNTG
jgi:hypothetical protein